jgi:hypothetical protein
MADDALAPLLQRALAAGGPALALDLRRGTMAGLAGGRVACVHVELVTGVPSEDDSRYRAERIGSLPAETAAQVEAARATARALAAHLGVDLHPPDGTARVWEEPSWIALQGPPPARLWAVRWSVVTWGEDGAERHASGEEHASASAGRAACEQVEQELSRRFEPPYDREVHVAGLAYPKRVVHPGAGPRALPSVHTLRTWAVEGRRPAEILRALDVAPVRARMIALGNAFSLDLRELGPVARWGEGALDDHALDAALTPLLERGRWAWAPPVLLRRARAAGVSVGSVLRASRPPYGFGILAAIRVLRDAFGLSIGAATMLAYKVPYSAETEGEFDAALGAELDKLRRG